MIDPVEDYLKLLRTIFDFDALKALLHKPDFTFTFDAMHGVSGPYAKRIFVQVCPCLVLSFSFPLLVFVFCSQLSQQLPCLNVLGSCWAARLTSFHMRESIAIWPVQLAMWSCTTHVQLSTLCLNSPT